VIISAGPWCVFPPHLAQISVSAVDILAFHEIQDGRRPPSWVRWGDMGPPTKLHSWCISPVKNLSWSLSSFQVIRIWIFVVHAWKSNLLPKNFNFGGFDPQIWGTSYRPPKGTSLHGTTHLEPSLVPIWSAVRAEENKEINKTNKERNLTAANWAFAQSPRPPTWSDRDQILHVW